MELKNLFWNASVEELTNGYLYDKKNKRYTCLICGKTFDDGIIYPINDIYFTAHKMTEYHISTQHDGMFAYLLSLNKNHTSLSENQSNVMNLMYRGLSDNEISKELGLSSSTVRNYRFKFKEKEKQAKIFLAVSELLNQSTSCDDDSLIAPHKSATCIDDRYNITEKDKESTLKTYFDENQHLKTLPSKEKKKIIVLTEIAKNFKANRTYSEYEINLILKRIYEDYAVIRRYLIQYGFLDRKKDNSCYWVK